MSLEVKRGEGSVSSANPFPLTEERRLSRAGKETGQLPVCLLDNQTLPNEKIERENSNTNTMLFTFLANYLLSSVSHKHNNLQSVFT